jgi:hypothetical protein
MSPSRRFLAILSLALASSFLLGAQKSKAPPRAEPRIEIDLDHILKGGINRRGELVGLHHEPSAPKSMRVDGTLCFVEFLTTSPGGPNDVRQARVILRDPNTKRVVREKFSTLFPKAWKVADIEQAIREAYADAQKRDTIDDRGRWQGRTAKGLRIDGYLNYDGDAIATAFPVYQPPRGSRNRP